jgi:hypothetical protein
MTNHINLPTLTPSLWLAADCMGMDLFDLLPWNASFDEQASCFPSYFIKGFKSRAWNANGIQGSPRALRRYNMISTQEAPEGVLSCLLPSLVHIFCYPFYEYSV